MRWQPYPQRKTTEVEWLGKIPDHWQVLKIKRLSLVKRGASPRPIGDPKYFQEDGEYAWVRISDVTASNHYLQSTTQRLSALGQSLSVPLQPGEVFLSIAGSVGKPIITKIKCCIHDGFVYFPHFNGDSEFLYYVFYSGQAYGGLGKLGTQLNLNTDIVGDIYIAYPPPDEQKQIVSFLDRETARIDALIQKKQRQIELLQEKRSALINHAVTKGLDPHVKMKDTGIDWLGSIPTHWHVKRLKFLFRNLDHRRIPLSAEQRSYMEKIYPYYGASGIIDSVEGYIFDEPLILVAEDGANLLSRSTPLAFVAEGKYWVNNHAHILKPAAAGPLKYWEGLLQTYDYTPLISGSAQPKLTAEELGTLPLPVPPESERYAISSFLERGCSRIDSMIGKVTYSIDHLREYRVAMIAAAVTGKIDVREEVPNARQAYGNRF